MSALFNIDQALLGTSALMGVIEREFAPVTFFTDTFFPGADFTMDGEEVIVEEIIGRKVAAMFNDAYTDGKPTREEDFLIRGFIPPYIKLDDPIDNRKALRRIPGEQFSGEKSAEARIMWWEERTALRHAALINNRIQMMAAEIVSTGRLDLTGLAYNGPQAILDFGRDPSLDIQLAAANVWSTGAAPIFDNMETAAEAVADLPGGVTTTAAYMGKTAWSNFSKYPEVQQLLDTRRGSTSTAEMGPGNGANVRMVGEFNGIDIYVVRESMNVWDPLTQQEVQKDLLDPRDVLIGNAAEMQGQLASGVLMDYEHGYQSALMASKSYTNDKRDRVAVKSDSAPLPVPTNPNAIARLRTEI